MIKLMKKYNLYFIFSKIAANLINISIKLMIKPFISKNIILHKHQNPNNTIFQIMKNYKTTL